MMMTVDMTLSLFDRSFSLLIFRIYITGPCGGKTTGQARLCTFFENLGWKVNDRTRNELLFSRINVYDIYYRSIVSRRLRQFF